MNPTETPEPSTTAPADAASKGAAGGAPAADAPPQAGKAAKGNPLWEILVTIIVPAIVLMQLSKPERLGPAAALVLALAFPVAWGLREAITRRKVSWLALLGVVSTLLTGGIGLLKVDPFWLAVKEAAVPTLIGLAVLGSNWTRWPLIRVLVFNPTLFDVAKVEQALDARGNRVPFELALRRATYALASVFGFSAVMNWVLARWFVTSPAGTEAFNEELGKLTLVSYPVIAVPSMVMMMALMWWLASTAKRLTGLDLNDMLHGGQPG